jgi:hypothetical protein
MRHMTFTGVEREFEDPGGLLKVETAAGVA